MLYVYFECLSIYFLLMRWKFCRQKKNKLKPNNIEGRDISNKSSDLVTFYLDCVFSCKDMEH